MIHNYGHGGSGWSLSGGAGTIATEMAMATGEKDIAVIGCGALGLSADVLLQRAGATVTIYAKDPPAECALLPRLGPLDAEFAHLFRGERHWPSSSSRNGCAGKPR